MVASSLESLQMCSFIPRITFFMHASGYVKKWCLDASLGKTGPNYKLILIFQMMQKSLITSTWLQL